eukprot:CAMPEP_0203675054 /NCGR_PEP_ID=MMETSP0090-20130426/18568_1 /ASSEMBLY_ACC=CAM_ASM_001088 /TAXON_ID=426623 /ORGANISM="Chaetoceros affinis, Strain CCMP159" /LENGTH=239 /DNA_ID=CAMNT_0050541109 /DNA_START=20 /DNA_END=739 /DNA_ORIENTATION=+
MSMVEEEPSHEIYASLIGKDAAKICHQVSASTATTLTGSTSTNTRSHSWRRSGSAIVPPDQNITCTITGTGREDKSGNSASAKTTKSTFANFYRRALQSHSSTTSTLTSAPVPLSQLSLDRSNKGFQMLTKMGFKEKDGGLGKMRQGQLSPVKTILKLDKMGLGRGRKRVPRVTHSHQQAAPISSSKDEDRKNQKKLTKGERKRRAKNQLTKEKMRDKKARMLINSNFPDEYSPYLGLN